MSKGSRHGGKGRSRKSRRHARPSAPVATKTSVAEASVSSTHLSSQQTSATGPAPRQATDVQQTALLYPHMLRELKTIGIIAGAMLTLMIVLAVVL